MKPDNISCAGFSLTHKNGLPLITDNRLTALGIPHGFTTRMGGVSEGEFESLNLAYSPERSDSSDNVERNYDILLSAFGVSPKNAVRTHQLHTDRVVACDSLSGVGFTSPDFTEGTDGLVTLKDGQLISARMADCLPILLCDTKSGAVGAVHSGWRGTIELIGTKAIRLMCDTYGSDKNDILVSFGPSVGACCYEVGKEFYENFINTHGDILKPAFSQKGASLYADMREVNRILMTKSGVPDKNIAIYTPCTCCNPAHFFSHRRQKSQRGTMAAVIVCKKEFI